VQDCQAAVLCAVLSAVQAAVMTVPLSVPVECVTVMDRRTGSLATAIMLNVCVPVMVVIHVKAGASKIQLSWKVTDRRHIRVIFMVSSQHIPVVLMYM
jgi:hypothetical protein